MTAEKSVHLPVPPEQAFALLTEPERLRRWKAVSARVDLRAGGEYRWTIVPGHVASGTFREIEPGKRLVFGWGWEGNHLDLPPDSSTVTVTFEPADGGTLVRLVHEGLTAEQEVGHLEGWSHFLERLETQASTGDAGADPWAWAPADLNPITSADATLAVLQRVLVTVGDDDLDSQTPCEDYTVAQLVEHLLGSLRGLGSMAGADVQVADTGSVEARVADAAQQALEAWARRGVEGTVDLGGQQLPAGLAAGILSLEFLIHAWDVATTVGTKVEVSDEVTTHVLEVAHQLISPAQREGGSFAAAVEVGADAHVLDRLIAFSGRSA